MGAAPETLPPLQLAVGLGARTRSACHSEPGIQFCAAAPHKEGMKKVPPRRYLPTLSWHPLCGSASRGLWSPSSSAGRWTAQQRALSAVNGEEKGCCAVAVSAASVYRSKAAVGA